MKQPHARTGSQLDVKPRSTPEVWAAVLVALVALLAAAFWVSTAEGESINLSLVFDSNGNGAEYVEGDVTMRQFALTRQAGLLDVLAGGALAAAVLLLWGSVHSRRMVLIGATGIGLMCLAAVTILLGMPHHMKVDGCGTTCGPAKQPPREAIAAVLDSSGQSLQTDYAVHWIVTTPIVDYAADFALLLIPLVLLPVFMSSRARAGRVLRYFLFLPTPVWLIAFVVGPLEGNEVASAIYGSYWPGGMFLVGAGCVLALAWRMFKTAAAGFVLALLPAVALLLALGGAQGDGGYSAASIDNPASSPSPSHGGVSIADAGGNQFDTSSRNSFGVIGRATHQWVSQ